MHGIVAYRMVAIRYGLSVLVMLACVSVSVGSKRGRSMEERLVAMEEKIENLERQLNKPRARARRQLAGT